MPLTSDRNAAPISLLSPAAMDAFAGMVGSSEIMQHVIACARALGRTEAPVLLEGESGVGKKLLARAIHDESARGSQPFVTVQCAGLPRELLARELFGYVDCLLLGARNDQAVTGKLRAAHGGTLFLDDVGHLPIELQPFLLRVLETGESYPLGSTEAHPVDFRVISACSRDLREEVRAGRFRMDLYYRLASRSISLPALRERTEDIPQLVAQFAREASAGAKPFTSAVFDAFARYSWPGNVRELRNVVESMLLLSPGEQVDTDALPVDLTAALERESLLPEVEGDTMVGLERIERNAIDECLRAHGGNLTRTARDLRIARSTLYAKLKKYGLEHHLDSLRFSGQRRSSVDLHDRS